ncbi:DUF2786 domain-containing protein [Acinetobacter ursingii]|uniref:DUF2786 domain-containing protein n=1 Tax=Acinetobacter ursingii TaxID=108980 RepID=UPI0021CD5735|nr:DUF2786 domain-containing protein [Acinetobacter ursingii]MCU4481326.1 DUF2786 domain-containing protein [Acinetobacter ursingii]MCU4505658.1 DUF2786 domain-containing protein [Acinetobacter ursingii]MCU4569604.1 DUF2786 domain-containing protein [Acinetobacter ursingii]
MTSGLNDSALRKIKRCMELSKSSNENEAALALKQMQALMNKHGVTAKHIMAADITEYLTYLSVKKKPAQWVLNLHLTVANALDCKSLVRHGDNRNIRLVFLGLETVTEIAGYAFEVLFRKLKVDRTNYINSELFRYKRANKTKYADAYCEGWVSNIQSKVKNLNPNLEIQEKIKAYTETKFKDYHPDKFFNGRSRFSRDDNRVQDAIRNGFNESKEINLFVATGHHEKNLIEAKE